MFGKGAGVAAVQLSVAGCHALGKLIAVGLQRVIGSGLRLLCWVFQWGFE